MISEKKKEILMKNWGEKADAMACKAEVRFYDTLSSWECFILAINPEEHDQIACIINGYIPDVHVWSFEELYGMYNSDGENLCLDNEFRPRLASEIFKDLRDRHAL